jgi:hypothetical protein
MYLAEDKVRRSQVELEAPARSGEVVPIAGPGGKWRAFPNSLISDHGAACCDIAHEWLTAYDFAQLNGGEIHSGPRWMREHSAWGPTVWPIHWCEAVDAKIVDCGVHAAMAHEVFGARGVTAFRAQFIQRYSRDTVASWRQNWAQSGASDHWIDGESIYHEGNAVIVSGNSVKLWDGSAGCWINPRGDAGYGSLAAVRIEAEDLDIPGPLNWGGRTIPLNQWAAV